jgi:hypothetical protein
VTTAASPGECGRLAEADWRVGHCCVVAEAEAASGRATDASQVSSSRSACVVAQHKFHAESRMAATHALPSWHVAGTFNGRFLGTEATRPLDHIRGIHCFTIRDGQVVANFIAYNGMMFALHAGVLPSTGAGWTTPLTVAANLMARA